MSPPPVLPLLCCLIVLGAAAASPPPVQRTFAADAAVSMNISSLPPLTPARYQVAADEERGLVALTGVGAGGGAERTVFCANGGADAMEIAGSACTLVPMSRSRLGSCAEGSSGSQSGCFACVLREGGVMPEQSGILPSIDAAARRVGAMVWRGAAVDVYAANRTIHASGILVTIRTQWLLAAGTGRLYRYHEQQRQAGGGQDSTHNESQEFYPYAAPPPPTAFAPPAGVVCTNASRVR